MSEQEQDEEPRLQMSGQDVLDELKDTLVRTGWLCDDDALFWDNGGSINVLHNDGAYLLEGLLRDRHPDENVKTAYVRGWLRGDREGYARGVVAERKQTP